MEKGLIKLTYSKQGLYATEKDYNKIIFQELFSKTDYYIKIKLNISAF